ncbi:hypothetical protein O5O45_29335 [Hahella aquimaris]|uniref:hypothetical protein n=1 Tax=Hahella sp. HNIBRBA332 TaxID=3015983 RepID=UPI00273B5C27|nr:hypothetical protein [Hahella sp. HNIBRBA332]WLQ13829.1 hypothetical protein O5O45_29335 [Hahella sp. HNIBRBA332]
MLDIPQLLSRVKLFRKKAAVRCAMCSMGGVGSTALARHIGSISDKTIREHAYTPAVYDDEVDIRLGYMFGNPYDAVLSLFRRNYQDMHAKAMNVNSPTPARSLRGMTLEEYLERGVDEFNIERQFDNWVSNLSPKHPTILIKYESLGSTIDKVLEFFQCEEPFELKRRNSSWVDQPSRIIEGLQLIYGDVAAKIDAMPPLKILLPESAHTRTLNAVPS